MVCLPAINGVANTTGQIRSAPILVPAFDHGYQNMVRALDSSGMPGFAVELTLKCVAAVQKIRPLWRIR
jgi:hypothetical protein